ncbi:tryptophan synthase subunit alpha [Pseudolysinimonas sp.]|uniref:tryptophan synthase subunit alpha n=1 Tax=Pseudolysinimonas sp. TaxID=2680009 RepID=UPI003F81A82D
MSIPPRSLVGYLPIGFPDLETSIDAAIALVDNGVDALELGLPYSDPVMDGLTIQKATAAALRNGFRVRDLFAAVEAIRGRVDVPTYVMTYWNPVVQYGIDRFARDLGDAGGAGLITPDITPDSAGEWIGVSDAQGLDRVFLAAPTSSEERLRSVVEASRGFVYAVSTMGVTGARQNLDAAARALVGRLREAGARGGDTLPALVGVGISTPDQVAEVLAYADGAIVGAKLVGALAEGGVPALAATAASLAQGKAR